MILEFIVSIVGWIVNGIQHIFIFITNIPTYIGYLLTLINNYIPSFLLPFVILGLTVAVIIRIKRLIF